MKFPHWKLVSGAVDARKWSAKWRNWNLNTHFHKWLPEINKNNVHTTSTFTPVRSADSSLRDCDVREMQTVEDILGKPV